MDLSSSRFLPIDITNKKSVSTVEVSSVHNLASNHDTKGIHINDVQLNPIERDKVAVGAANGSISIYNLGAGLVNGALSVQEEQKHLDRLLKEAMADNDVGM